MKKDKPTPPAFESLSKEELKEIEEEVDRLVDSSDEIEDAQIEVIAELFSYYSEVAQVENQVSVEWIKIEESGS